MILKGILTQQAMEWQPQDNSIIHILVTFISSTLLKTLIGFLH